MTWPRRATTAGIHNGYRRCPTAMESVEIRVFTVAGRTTDEPDVVLQVYRRLNHDLSSPWGPSSAAVRVPCRYARHLAELIIQAAAGETTTGAVVTAAAIDAMLAASRAYRAEQKARGLTRDRRVELRLMLEAALAPRNREVEGGLPQ
jgi:hypothetical protein